MGCGIGCTSVLAARKGARQVMSVDCSPYAVQNTRINIARHGVEAVVSVLESDLFASLSGQRFETIYWNLPWIYTPESALHASPLEKTLVDPGYRQLKRFLQEIPYHLTPKGRVLVGFGNFGNVELFLGLARKFGYHIEPLEEQASRADPQDVYLLYQLRRQPVLVQREREECPGEVSEG